VSLQQGTTIQSRFKPIFNCTSGYSKKNLKSFPSHKAHRAALISVSSALSQTPVYTARPRIRG